MFGKDIGKKLGENISSGAKDIREGAKNLKEGLEGIGNLEKAAEHIKHGLIIAAGIIGFVWLVKK